ncbi:transposase, partial [Sphingobacterium siyangense]|uniref:transposase n=1 Tax=Sphingobacterium siyangense TaxID=459529 RepID=UPI003C721200
REHGISQGTFYSWKNKYSGMDISQLKQLKEMEKELAQYKKIVDNNNKSDWNFLVLDVAS